MYLKNGPRQSKHFLLCVDLFTFSPGPFSSDFDQEKFKGRGGGAGAVREEDGIGMPLVRLKASRRGARESWAQASWRWHLRAVSF